MARRSKTNPIDRAIDQEYTRQANGRQINIMNIGPLFNQARISIGAGLTPAQAVSRAILLYCEPVQG